jgi:hypothetical protein
VTPVILAIRETFYSTTSDILGFTFKVATPTPLALGTAVNTSPLTAGNIRQGTTQYYRAAVTAGTPYNLIFQDVAGTLAAANYADVRVTAQYSDTTSSGFFTTGDATTAAGVVTPVTVYTVSPPAPNPGWVILQVTETTSPLTPFTGTRPFGIKLYP